MKLFQQMLVAGASLSLITPLVAQASDINLDGMNNYSRSKSKKSSKRFDSKSFINNVNNELASVNEQNAQQINFEAGSFSETTTFDGKAIFAIGAVDGNDELNDSGGYSNMHQQTAFAYVYQINLNTSFSGDDNLYVRLKTGDGWDGAFDAKPASYHIDAKDNGNDLKVDKIWYTFPVGDKFTATVGPLIENYYMLAATPSVYKPGALKAFKLGGHSSAFGASTSAGAGLKYEADNGFAVSTTLNSKGADNTKGIFTKEDQNKVNTQVAYTADNYHLSATYSMQRGWNSWAYYSTYDLQNGASGTGDSAVKADAIALRGWWRPDTTGTAMPSISVGYDVINFTNHSNGVNEGSGYMVGFNWEDMLQPEDKIGIAFGQPMKATSATSGNTLSEVDPFLWEAYYAFRPNDSIEVRPAVFGGTDVYEDTEDDVFGALVTTTFKF